MSLSVADKKLKKVQLEEIGHKYKKTKDQKLVPEAIVLLEPMIRGKVLQTIYKFEKYNKRHISDFEDLCQDMRMIVNGILDRWDSKRGTLYTYSNLIMGSVLSTKMREKHNRNRNKICDYTSSFEEKLYSEEVNEMRLSDKFCRVEADQEMMIGVMELSREISKAIQEEIGDSKTISKIFKLYLQGHKPSKIAKFLNRTESFVRFKIGHVVSKVTRKVRASYGELYFELFPEYTKFVKFEIGLN